MDWAVIKFYGKQFIVKPKTTIKVDDVKEEVGEKVAFDQVLLLSNGEVKIGKPIIENIKIRGKIVKKFLAPKLTVVKFKPKSRYLRRIGVRRKFAEIEIEKFILNK